MKTTRHLLLTLFCSLPLFLCEARATSTDDTTPLCVYLNNGQADVFPADLIKSQVQADGKLSITLISDSVISYNLSEVSSVGAPPTDLPTFTSFKFNNKYNDQVFTDVIATISADRVTATVGAIGKRLTPSFQMNMDNAKAYVNGIEQQSKVSRLRFEKPITYTLALPEHRQLTYRLVQDEIWSKPEEVVETSPITLTADMLSTNAPSNYDEGLDKLLDKDINTFFHSTWSSNAYDTYQPLPLDQHPYIEVSLQKAINKFRISYTSRPNSDKYFPTALLFQASYDDGKTWTDLRTLTSDNDGLPTTGYSISYTSPVIKAEKPFTLLRITMTSASYKNYLVWAEFSMEEVLKEEIKESELLEPARYAYEWIPYGREVPVSVSWLTDEATQVPRIDIDIEGGAMVEDKETYLNALITIDGAEVFPDFQDSVKIKGRGNSSWAGTWGKSPYRLKFDSSVKPFGLTKGKSWVLLANRQTGSMLSNAMAMKIASMVQTAGANRIVPVELYINGNYRGSYNFTQHVGLANNSIDLEDETYAVLLELDSYYDEDYKFMSSSYDLPVNIKDPDLSEYPSPDSKMAGIQEDFNNFCDAVYSGTDEYASLLNADMFARFMLVNELVLNLELGHPKSTFLYKEDLRALHSRYVFGPVWDFDWAYGYETTSSYCDEKPERNYYSELWGKGYSFFGDIRHNSEEVRRACYKEWKDFMEQHLDELIEYVHDYYNYAKPSFEHNAELWGDGYSYGAIADKTADWLRKRAEYIYNNIEAFELDKPMTISIGDVNQDGYITAADVVCVLNYILGLENESFSFGQADADYSKSITINDAVHIIALAMNQSAAATRQLNLPRAEATLQPQAFQASVGTETAMPLVLNITEGSYNALQFDITLPAEVLLTDVQLPEALAGCTHHFTQLNESTYRILLYSSAGRSLPYGPCTLSLGITPQTQPAPSHCLLSIENALIATAQGEDLRIAPRTTAFGMGQATDIHDVRLNESGIRLPADIYNTEGRLIRKAATTLEGLEQGIYIINGNKVIL
ncbi:MAG: CotH kinase family protein [Bacteroidaceae bacterium]|nr:CotH kinase family protein [Bacteroidaceae bacterium]